MLQSYSELGLTASVVSQQLKLRCLCSVGSSLIDSALIMADFITRRDVFIDNRPVTITMQDSGGTCSCLQCYTGVNRCTGLWDSNRFDCFFHG